ncbi:MAG TPA: phosphodiester glycosidase family protein [Acidimicrobiales bacterium]|jgi:hypothetical protein
MSASARALAVLAVLALVAAPLSLGSPLASATTGLYVYPVVGTPYNIDAPIHLVSFYGAPFSLGVGLAHGKVDGGLETPSAICRSTPHCVAAINGDYFEVASGKKADPGDPVGGLTSGCVLLHTPEVSHQQADLDNASVSTGFSWNAALSVGTTSVAINAINQQLPIPGVGLRGTLLYTSAYALPTPTAAGRSTYQFKEVGTAVSPTIINQAVTLEYLGRTAGAIHVPAGRVAISTSNPTAFASLASGASVSLAVNSTMGCDDIGGHPIIINKGVPGVVSPSDTAEYDRDPRTIVGWTTLGETVLITVGGRDGVSGATWNEMLSLLRALNVQTALSLDGGSSTSMYADGRSLYSARASERPVSTALLVLDEPATSTTSTTTTTTTTLP